MRGAKLNRRRFQYSLRSLLLFMVLANVFMAWLCPLWRAARQQREAVAAIHAVGAVVVYDYEAEHTAKWWASATVKWSAPVPPGPAWARKLLGDDLFTNVVEVGYDGWANFRGRSAESAGLSRFLCQPRETGPFSGRRFASLPGDRESPENPITDRCLEHIGKLPRLEVLELGWSCVSDASLKNLEGLTRLRQLNLARTPITDHGLEHLQGLTQLRELNLARTDITDRGLRHLVKLTRLEVLDLSGTTVTEAGLAQLAQLPELRLLGLGRMRRLPTNDVVLRDAQTLCVAAPPETKVGGYTRTPTPVEASWCEQRLHRALPRCEISLQGGLFRGDRLVHAFVPPGGQNQDADRTRIDTTQTWTGGRGLGGGSGDATPVRAGRAGNWWDQGDGGTQR